MSPNVFVFLILDCCRVFQENKGGKYEGEPVGGQIYIAFGARVGNAATAQKNEASKFTKKFIESFKNE
jgi:hypothetical protein